MIAQTELMWTIAPPPAFSRCGIAYLATRNGPRRLVRISRSNSSTGQSATGFHSVASMPALLMTASSPPIAAAAASTTACALSGSETSPTTATAVPPAAVIRSTVSFVRASSRPPQATAAPSAANRTATSRPIPLEAPVTSARLP